jgi:flagellar biosynthesis protein
VRSDRDLVRLLDTVDIDSPIPLEAFQAVAEILSYIYRKQDKLKPQAPRSLEKER